MSLENFAEDNLDLHTLSCNTQLGALACDAWHHYYHYQSSAQYLWLAYTYDALGQQKEASTAIDKALFQDHFNAEALERKKNGTRHEGRGVNIPHYDKHPLLDGEFCLSIGESPSQATLMHDEGIKALEQGEYTTASHYFNTAIAVDPQHSNSFFGLGKTAFVQQDYEKSREVFTEATRLSHLRHNAYHRLASNAHFERGKTFLAQGEMDLAINDFNKALDLWHQNEEAIKMRSDLYAARKAL